VDSKGLTLSNWVLWTLSIVLISKTWTHNVVETSGEGKETPTPLGPLERANLNHWTPLPSPEDGHRSSFPNVFSLFSYYLSSTPLGTSQSHIATDGQSVSMSWCRAQSGTFDQRFF
jgi:hypothetical protein